MSEAYPLILNARSAGNLTDEEVSVFISSLTILAAITTASKAFQGKPALPYAQELLINHFLTL